MRPPLELCRVRCHRQWHEEKLEKQAGQQEEKCERRQRQSREQHRCFSDYINGKPCSHDNTLPSPFHADNGLLKQNGAVELGLRNSPKANKCTENVFTGITVFIILWEAEKTQGLSGIGSYTDNQ